MHDKPISFKIPCKFFKSPHPIGMTDGWHFLCFSTPKRWEEPNMWDFGRKTKKRAMPIGTLAMGAAIGAAFALLYAPASGASTRRYLARQTRAGQRRMNGFVKKSREAMEEGRSSLESAVGQGRDYLNSWAEYARRA